MKKEITEFLRQSNAIEEVYDIDSLQQALYAWEYLSKQREVTTDVVRKTHKILMLHQPLQPDERGYFRKIQVSVGGRECMRWERLTLAITDWCDRMNLVDEEGILDREFLSKQLHVEYEKIHPFVDGNGRSGRLFFLWWRLKNGLPILIYKADERQEYYKLFRT